MESLGTPILFIDDGSCDLKKGDRIRLLKMSDDPDPIKPGELGMVTFVTKLQYFDQTQVGVRWDSGRSLSVLIPPDVVEKVLTTEQWEEVVRG